MSIYKRLSFWFALFMLAFTVLFVITALGYSERPRLFPLIVGIPTAIAGVVIVAAEKWPKLLKPFDVNVGMKVKIIKSGVDAEAEIEEGSVDITSQEKFKRFAWCLGWMVGYVVIVFFVGFNIANLVIPLAYLMVHPKMKWWKAVIFAGIFAFLMWLTFDYLMQAGMWQGILFDELLPPF